LEIVAAFTYPGLTRRLGRIGHQALPALLALLMMLAWPGQAAHGAAGERSLHIGVYAFPPGLGNPHSQTNLPAIFIWPAVLEPLTVMGADNELQPHLALDWEALDEFTWRFTLRRNVRFSNGEPFNAAAVVRTLEWLRTPQAATMMLAGETANLASATAIDEHTVEIRTHTPDAMLPRAMSVVRMVAPEYWQQVGPAGFARQPIGTGPFEVVRWGDTQVEMRAWSGSWRAPRIDRLVFSELPDAPSRVQGLQSGALDIALQLSPDDGPAVRAAGAQLIPRAAGSVLGLSFITTRPSPLSDPRVRRALNMAIDRERIVAELFHGTTHIATQHASRHAFGHHPDLTGYPYDPEGARRLLAEAGYPEGFTFTAQVVIGAGANDSAMYQQLAAELRLIGVHLELRIMPTQVLLRNIFTGDWVGHAFGMDFGSAPFLDGWRPFRMHSCLWSVPWFCDESLTPLIEQVRTSFDLDERRELLHRLLEAYHAAAPSLPVYEVVGYDAVAARVRNYRNVLGVINFDELEIVAD
jgi:peptide/nickel transport system substrate-binding protein